MSDDAPEEPGFDDRLTLTLEILAMRDTVQGWQQAGSPNGLPVDLHADRALSDAVQHLTAAAAALELLSGFTNPPAGGTYLSIDAMGRDPDAGRRITGGPDPAGAGRPPGRRTSTPGHPGHAGVPGGPG